MPLTQAAALTFSHSPNSQLRTTHTHTEMRKNDTFSFSHFLCFYILEPGVQEATLCFHVTKHTGACVELGEVNGLIHHSGLGLSELHQGISLSTLKKWDCWRCLWSLRKLKLRPVLRLTDDLSGESNIPRLKCGFT